MEELHPSKWTKIERVRFLLDHWSDIFDPNVTSPGGSPSDGDGVPLLPKMARDRSVLEMQHCLSALAIDHPIDFSHLKAYRCNAEWRQVKAKHKIKLPSGRWTEIDGWAKERIVPSWISLARVADGEVYIARLFRGDLFIPLELWKGLTEPISA